MKKPTKKTLTTALNELKTIKQADLINLSYGWNTLIQYHNFLNNIIAKSIVTKYYNFKNLATHCTYNTNLNNFSTYFLALCKSFDLEFEPATLNLILQWLKDLDKDFNLFLTTLEKYPNLRPIFQFTYSDYDLKNGNEIISELANSIKKLKDDDLKVINDYLIDSGTKFNPSTNKDYLSLIYALGLYSLWVTQSQLNHMIIRNDNNQLTLLLTSGNFLALNDTNYLNEDMKALYDDKAHLYLVKSDFKQYIADKPILFNQKQYIHYLTSISMHSSYLISHDLSALSDTNFKNAIINFDLINYYPSLLYNFHLYRNELKESVELINQTISTALKPVNEEKNQKLMLITKQLKADKINIIKSAFNETMQELKTKNPSNLTPQALQTQIDTFSEFFNDALKEVLSEEKKEDKLSDLTQISEIKAWFNNHKNNQYETKVAINEWWTQDKTHSISTLRKTLKAHQANFIWDTNDMFSDKKYYTTTNLSPSEIANWTKDIDSLNLTHALNVIYNLKTNYSDIYNEHKEEIDTALNNIGAISNTSIYTLKFFNDLQAKTLNEDDKLKASYIIFSFNLFIYFFKNIHDLIHHLNLNFDTMGYISMQPFNNDGFKNIIHFLLEHEHDFSDISLDNQNFLNFIKTNLSEVENYQVNYILHLLKSNYTLFDKKEYNQDLIKEWFNCNDNENILTLNDIWNQYEVKLNEYTKNNELFNIYHLRQFIINQTSKQFDNTFYPIYNNSNVIFKMSELFRLLKLEDISKIKLTPLTFKNFNYFNYTKNQQNLFHDAINLYTSNFTLTKNMLIQYNEMVKQSTKSSIYSLTELKALSQKYPLSENFKPELPPQEILSSIKHIKTNKLN